MQNQNHIPVYSLDSFQKKKWALPYVQVERFDAHRHFQVAYPHRHDFYEILFLYQGTGYHIIDTNRYEIKPPCVFFLSPGQAHKLELSQDIEGFIFLFTAEFYALFESNKNKLLEYPFFFSVSQENPPVYISKRSDSDFLHQLCVRGIYAIQEKSDFFDEYLYSILHTFLLTCVQLYPKELQQKQQARSHILVKKFFLALEHSLTKNLSVHEYAKLLAMSPNHFTYSVKSIMGKTPIKIIQEKQIAEIKRLLLHSTLSVSEISDYMNFTDKSYCTKFFKKHVGQTPLAYRTQQCKHNSGDSCGEV